MHVIALFLTAALLVLFGIISWRRPDIAGGEYRLKKAFGFYSVILVKASNPYYKAQIKSMATGMIISGALLMIFTVIYCVYPDILSILLR